MVFPAGRHWWLAPLIIAASAGIAFVDTRLHKKYKRTGAAVRIVYSPIREVSFPEARRLPLRVLSAPSNRSQAESNQDRSQHKEAVARIGMIVTVLSVVAVGLLHFLLQGIYASKQQRPQGDPQ